MEKFDLNNIFQGISTLLQSDPAIMYARIGLILLGILLVYLGRRGVLEPLVMIPMGLGMAAVNAGVLIFPGGTPGNPLSRSDGHGHRRADEHPADRLSCSRSIPFSFSNGLIACLIFMGIGTMLDINFLLAKPLQSMFLALCAELGTFAVVPIAYAMGLSPSDSASIAMVGGADGRWCSSRRSTSRRRFSCRSPSSPTSIWALPTEAIPICAGDGSQAPAGHPDEAAQKSA